ncbi:hypothetical protein [Delftia sp. JD2]|uniref:hypothetical protein n=1 Tax=Delftia sp. JD2 TaxID=469553 RepID=UPI000A02B65A|nr:hypothetical protein [Delftia sp. JD2]
MQDISKVRFESLAAYCRQPEALLAAEEVRWLQAHNEAILVVVIRDITDDDYSAMLLARDLKERYRWVEMTPFLDTVEEALAAAPERVERVFSDLETQRVQGDEKGEPVDFFTPVVAAVKLNPDFVKITTLGGYSPAVELMKPMMRWYEDADGNFVEQFQTTGFNTRLWELYLFAALVEAGYIFDKTEPMPDYCARNALGELCIEATTINPSRTRAGALIPPPPHDTEEQMLEYERKYMPTRYAGPLTTKLAKKYWEKAHVEGRPLAIAIQDFHAPNLMSLGRTALPMYLYGMEWNGDRATDGTLVITPKKLKEHVWGTKVVASDFFSLPGAENISAVIANASATVSKFNRMGVLAGFGSKEVRMLRAGKAVNPDPNADMPLTFVHDVSAADYSEAWVEGMEVFHNPNALHPLSPAMLPGAAHHRLLADGQLASLMPPWHPLGSVTQIFMPE